MIISWLKKFRHYDELRYIYRSFVVYKKLFSYIYYRFFIGPKIFAITHPIDNVPISDDYTIHILCGHSGIMMLLWSMASWYNSVSFSGKLYIHEDGSFTDNDKKLLKKLLPKSEIVDFEFSSKQARGKWLVDYPSALAYREKPITDKKNIFAVKLIDPRFVGSAKKKLVLDTDLLWFQNPSELLDMMNQDKIPFAMNVGGNDVDGDDRMDFVFSDGSELEKQIRSINSGIVGYDTENYKINDLEEFCSRVDDNANPHFVEQAGYAWILSRGRDFCNLSIEKYHIKNPLSDITVLKHYTKPRRESFWYEGVKILFSRFEKKM